MLYLDYRPGMSDPATEHQENAMDTNPEQHPTVTVDLPARFYFDHEQRGLPSGRLVKMLSSERVVRVELDRAGYDDLLDDALHYNHPEYWEEYRGLVLSARAVIKRLEKADRPTSTVDAWRNE